CKFIFVSISGRSLSKCATFPVWLCHDVDHFSPFAIIKARESGLFGFFIDELDLVYDFSRQRFEGYPWISAEELFSVYNNLGNFLAMCFHIPLLIQFYTRYLCD